MLILVSVSIICLFPEASYRPTAQPPTWRTRACSSSGLYPSINPTWLDLPGTKVPAGTTLSIIKTHKLHLHNKVSSLRSSESGKRCKKYHWVRKTCAWCFAPRDIALLIHSKRTKIYGCFAVFSSSSWYVNEYQKLPETTKLIIGGSLCQTSIPCNKPNLSPLTVTKIWVNVTFQPTPHSLKPRKSFFFCEKLSNN